jgi:hypothetical protein
VTLNTGVIEDTDLKDCVAHAFTTATQRAKESKICFETSIMVKQDTAKRQDLIAKS